MYYLWLLLHDKLNFCDKVCMGHKALKSLLIGPLQEKFSDSWTKDFTPLQCE